MIDLQRLRPSVVRQRMLLQLNRSGVYYQPVPENAANLTLTREICQMPRMTAPQPEHRKYPYLLQDLTIDQPNQIWCSDITYIPMRRGFLYHVAIMDCATHGVLA